MALGEGAGIRLVVAHQCHGGSPFDSLSLQTLPDLHSFYLSGSRMMLCKLMAFILMDLNQECQIGLN